MKVGDLVEVGPSVGGTYIITNLKARDYDNRELPTCVMLGQLEGSTCLSGPMPMDRKWIKVISESQ